MSRYHRVVDGGHIGSNSVSVHLDIQVRSVCLYNFGEILRENFVFLSIVFAASSKLISCGKFLQLTNFSFVNCRFRSYLNMYSAFCLILMYLNRRCEERYVRLKWSFSTDFNLVKPKVCVNFSYCWRVYSQFLSSYSNTVVRCRILICQTFFASFRSNTFIFSLRVQSISIQS